MTNNFDTLLNLKNQIENIDSIHHIKILKIFKKHEIKYSENRNGIFVNMNSISDSAIVEIKHVLDYIKQQEIHLKNIESLKDKLNEKHFANNNKEKPPLNINENI
jgi:hypothetical protein